LCRPSNNPKEIQLSSYKQTHQQKTASNLPGMCVCVQSCAVCVWGGDLKMKSKIFWQNSFLFLFYFYVIIREENKRKRESQEGWLMPGRLNPQKTQETKLNVSDYRIQSDLI
jgi:hypothetical protein